MYLLFIASIIVEVVIGTIFLGNNSIKKSTQQLLGIVVIACLAFQLFYLFFS